MQVTDARKMSAAEIAALMKKKAFDEVELSPRIQAGTDAMFGRHMTAAQVVDQIVADVRKNGDESLFYYTKLIDRGSGSYCQTGSEGCFGACNRQCYEVP